MEISSTTLLIVGAISFVLGVFASILVNTLQQGNEEPVPDGAESPPGGKKGRYQLITRIWRDKKNETLIVEMNGRSYMGPDPLNAQDRAEIERTARDLRRWLGMGLAEPVQPQTSAPVQAEAQMEPVVNVAPVVRPVQSVPAAPPVAAPTGKKNAAAKAGTSPAPAPTSIVMQIEDILQDLISRSTLTNRSVHIFEDPARGVLVSIGERVFEGIDAVPDQEVKTIIRSAVTEWEKKQS